ncbi:syntaxin 61 family protein [Striga asiatica]|uniref:Syntaxin 61 family protein n=1 Tax=Striga asiatica TaxID=4170 RepID=A0A5A7PR14_STRAF|nr:syntaxin 61 family protein [Striga asiatica]
MLPGAFAGGSAYHFAITMSSAHDPFYIVKEEIQESFLWWVMSPCLKAVEILECAIPDWTEISLDRLSIDKLLSTFHQWERMPSEEKLSLTKELIAACESIEWQVDELDKAIAVASKDPALYGIDEVELDKRRKWTTNARNQLLLIRQQDEELDELSASVQRIGGVGLTIHEELLAQEKIIDDLGMEMDSTSNRLDFVQKKVAMVMKKASAKGQFMMILFLLVLFIILFVLVFLT